MAFGQKSGSTNPHVLGSKLPLAPLAAPKKSSTQKRWDAASSPESQEGLAGTAPAELLLKESGTTEPMDQSGGLRWATRGYYLEDHGGSSQLLSGSTHIFQMGWNHQPVIIHLLSGSLSLFDGDSLPPKMNKCPLKRDQITNKCSSSRQRLSRD